MFDEYDAGRPDVMFVIQRLLESQGKLTLLDQNTIITPNRYFRIFGTCNTLGLGDTSGLYYGTQNLNQGQLDRWNIFCALNFLEPCPLDRNMCEECTILGYSLLNPIFSY